MNGYRYAAVLGFWLLVFIAGMGSLVALMLAWLVEWGVIHVAA